MARTCLTVVLAAGEGTRMKSAHAKVLHEVGGLPMVRHVTRAAAAGGSDRIALVTGRDGESVADSVAADDLSPVVHPQIERLGTAHAVLAARETIAEGFNDLLVLFGDTPLIRPETLIRARAVLRAGAGVCVIGFRPPDPKGYGRLIESDGALIAIREEKDASELERRIGFCNAGIMAIAGEHALTLLDSIGNDNAKGEYYLTDIVEIAHAGGHSVRAIEADADEVAGVNDRLDLAGVEAAWQSARRRDAMREGATLIAPETVTFSHDTALEPDVTVEPNVVFGAGVHVESGAVIHAFSHLEGARVAGGAAVGPFARLRPGTDLGERAKVGNFCELKNATVAAGAKVNHLSYIGDAGIGANANIGAGTITCNYDGAGKHRTTFGADSFIGSNTALVAPVTVGDAAYVGTGSVVTDDVPDGALAIARERQVTKPDRGRAIMERNRAAKTGPVPASSEPGPDE